MTNKWLEQPLYKKWLSMRQRCNNPKSTYYKYYGGRGVRVCDEWSLRGKGYKNFYAWAIQNGYKKGLTLDRVDVNGNYEPNNCRWVTMKEQSINKRNTYYVVYNGVKIPLKKLADMLGVNYFTLHSRLKKNNIEDCCQRELYSTREIANSGERYISIVNGKYYIVRIKGKWIGEYKTLNEAIQARNNACDLCVKLFKGEEV